MTEIHDHEVDTSEPVLRALLDEQCPAWADAPAHLLHTTGTSNTLWRLATPASEPDVIVRLPRQIGGDRSISAELRLLPALADTSMLEHLELPSVLHAGRPSDAYPMAWMAAAWLDGRDLWSTRDAAATDGRLAHDIAAAVRAIRTIEGMPVDRRRDADRGGAMPGLLDRLAGWLDDPAWAADRLVDRAAIRRRIDEAAEVATEPVAPRFVHGDLIPGNLLVDRSDRLRAIIDWGGAALADPAQDLAPAWSIFDAPARTVFRDALEVDDAAWIRGRTIELEHAVGGVLYYVPRRHPLGDVMATTLDRILADR
ncbi:MAG: phosphotransferase [Actinomycetota bacterium]